MNNTHTNHFEDKVRETVTMPQADPQFVSELWERLASQPARKLSVLDHLAAALHSRWMMPATALLILVVIFTALGPQRVLAAVQALFNYLPGVGHVSDIDQASLLSGSVSEERDGYTVTVENFVASPDRTWLRLKIEGWQEGTVLGKQSSPHEAPSLLAGNGIVLQPNQSDIFVGDALYAEYQFAALPADKEEVTLTVPQLPETEQGKAPEDWIFIIKLRKAEPKDTLPETWSGARRSTMVNGITLSILQIVRTAEQTTFTLRIDTPTLNDTLAADWYSRLSLEDAQGNIYPVTFEQSLSGRTLVFRTRKLANDTNMTLRLDQLHLVNEAPDDRTAPAFLLDLGEAPSIGQHWMLDQLLTSGNVKFHIVGVTLQISSDGHPLLIFDVERPGENVQGLLLGCSLPACTQSTIVGPGKGQLLNPTIQFQDLPGGKIPIILKAYDFSVTGPWEIDWQPNTIPISLWQPPTPVAAADAPPHQEPTTSLPRNTPEAQLPDTPLADNVRRLLTKGFQELYGQAGWVHVIYEIIEPDSPLNGRVTGPAHSVGETWQYVEPDGTISKQVWLDKTVDGVTWQKSARVGKTQVNFTAGTAVDDPTLETKAQLDPLLDAILQADRTGVIPFGENVIFDGRRCLLVTLQTLFDPPASFPPLPEKVVRIDHKIWIDEERGQIVKVEIVYILDDGTELVLQTTLYPLKERIQEPPDEVLDLLDQVIP